MNIVGKIIFAHFILLNLRIQISSVLAITDCIDSFCDQCDSASICQQCKEPYAVNEDGYCSASKMCSLNDFYQPNTKKCESKCLEQQKENPILNICDSVSSCSQIRYIGNKYLPTDFSAPLFVDSQHQIYIQGSSNDKINIYDSTTMQFQAQIKTNMKIVNKYVYDNSSQNIIATNILGEIEIWNILTTNLVFKTKVSNYDRTNVFYIQEINIFFYIDNNRNLSVINDLLQPPKILPFKLTNTDFDYIYVEQSKSVVFVGSQKEVLHLSADNFKQIYWNKYDPNIQLNEDQVYRSKLFKDFIIIYNQIIPYKTYLYFPLTQKWIYSSKINPNEVGYFMGFIFHQISSTHIRLINIDGLGNITEYGPPYPLSQLFYVSYDNKKKGIGLTITDDSSSQQQSIHVRFDLDLSPEKQFTEQMISNITPFPFSLRIIKFILLDEINRKLVVRSYEGNLLVFHIDSFQIVYSIKQFQQPPFYTSGNLSIQTTRIDPLIQSTISAATLTSYQNINLYNNKRKFRSEKFNQNLGRVVQTKDFLIGQLAESQVMVMVKKSNMQKIGSITYSPTDQDNIINCPNEVILLSKNSNDFLTACKNNIVYAAYNSVNQEYSLSSYPLNNSNFQFKEINDQYILICYIVDCYYIDKSALNTQNSLISGLNGVIQITSKSDSNYFVILTKQMKAIYFDVGSWSEISSYQIRNKCSILHSSSLLEGNRVIYACRADQLQIQISFYILQLVYNELPSPPSFVYRNIVIQRTTSIMNIIDGQTISSMYLDGNKLYFYLYSFIQEYSSIIEKAQNVVHNFSSDVLMTPTYDLNLRKIYFSYNTMVYSNDQYIGEVNYFNDQFNFKIFSFLNNLIKITYKQFLIKKKYQIQSYSYQKRYYNIIEEGKTDKILKFKVCSQNSFISVIMRQGSIFIQDNMYNKSYQKSIIDISDVLIDSSQNLVFYLLASSNILYSYNYILDTFKNELQVTSNLTYFKEFINPVYEKSFIIYNNVNLDIQFCQYTTNVKEMNCYHYILKNKSIDDQKGIIVKSVICYENVLYVKDSYSNSYYLQVNLKRENGSKISLNLQYSDTENISSVFPSVSLLVVQNVDFKDGFIADQNGFQITQIKFPSLIIDVVSIDSGYLFISSSTLYRLRSNFSTLYTITTNQVIKKVMYYQKQQLILILSAYQNEIKIYDLESKLQLQSIRVGSYSLEYIMYLQQEDIFVVYNSYGQIYRIDLNQPDIEDQIISEFISDDGLQLFTESPILFFNQIINKLFFFTQNKVYAWNCGPFIGEKLNFKRIRYLSYKAVQSQQNPDYIYYSDIQNYIWLFKSNQQELVGITQSDVLDLFVSSNFLSVYCYQDIMIYKITNLGNTLVQHISLATTAVQMVIQFKSDVFGYITSEFDFYILDISTNANAQPNYVTTLPTTPLDLILIQDGIVIISLINSSPLFYKLGDSSYTLMVDLPNLKTFMGFQLVPNEQSILIVEETNIIKLDQQTLKLVSSLNFPEYDSAGMIESYAFDNLQNLLYIHYSNENYVSIIPYTLVKTDIKSVASCNIFQVKFLIQENYVAIYCQFQINFHQRNPQLQYLQSFRNPILVKSIINLIILNDQYMIITQDKTIDIYRMSPIDLGNPTFTLYRQFNSTESQIFQSKINDDKIIKITGVGYEGYFNNLIFMGNSCYNKFLSIKNKLNLINQLNQINLVEEVIQKYYYFEIEVGSQSQNKQLPFIDELDFSKNNALVQFVSQQPKQQLLINNTTFSDISIKDLIISDFTFVINEDSNNIIFNQNTKVVIIKKIIISSNLKNVCFKFSNLKKVIISNLVVQDISISDSQLFTVMNVDQLIFQNVNITNTQFIRSQLLLIQSSTKVNIDTFNVLSTTLLNYSKCMFINISNTNVLKMINFNIIDITGIDFSIEKSNETELFERDDQYLQKQLNHLMYFQKVDNVTLIRGNCSLLQKVSFIKMEDFYTDGNIMQNLEDSKFIFSNITLQSNQGMNSLIFVTASKIIIHNIKAISNECSDCNGGVFYFHTSKKFLVNHSYFELNKAIHGGTFSHISCISNDNLISDTTFLSNSARGNGGAFILNNCDLKMKDVNFISNSALIGGALRYKDLVPMFISQLSEIQSTITFKNNKADIFGNNYGSYFGRFSIEQMDNSITIGGFNMQNFTLQSYYIDNFSSGDEIQFKVQIKDEESDPVKFNHSKMSFSKTIPNSIRSQFQKIIFNVVSLKDEILIEGPNIASYQSFQEQQNVFLFSAVQLISQPKQSGTLFIKTNFDFEIPNYILNKLDAESPTHRGFQSNILDQEVSTFVQTINKNQYSISVNFKFRECIVGEIYKNITQTKTFCYRCPLGSYSLEEPNYYKIQECHQCLSQNTKECGNSTVVLKDGFWRVNEQSDIIIECVNKPSNCLDSIQAKGYCIEGHIGPLCEQCDTLGEVWGGQYSQTVEFECAPCTDYTKTYIRWFLIFVAVNIYILGTMYMFFMIYQQKSTVYYLRLTGMVSFGTSARRDQSSTYLKFLMNYAQLQSNINQFKYEIFVLSFPSLFGQPASQLNSATDCQVVVYQNKLLIKNTVMLSLPIIFYLWICLVYLIQRFFTKRTKNDSSLYKQKLFTLFLFSFNLFQPNIVSFLIQSVSCRSIGDIAYVTSDITMQCYNQEHMFVIIIATIGMILWILVVPIYIYLQLIKIKHPEWLTVQYAFGFLYMEFKKEHFYWEIVRQYLKLLIVFYINILREDGVTQFAFIVITLISYYILIHSRSPYETHHMNVVDKQMILSLVLQVVLNAIIKDVEYNSTQYVITVILAVTINISTFSFLLITILTQKISFITQNINKFKFKLQKIKCLSNLKFLQVPPQAHLDFKRFQNWKNLSLRLQTVILRCQRIKYQQIRENFNLKQLIAKESGQLPKSSNKRLMKSGEYDEIFKEIDDTNRIGNSQNLMFRQSNSPNIPTSISTNNINNNTHINQSNNNNLPSIRSTIDKKAKNDNMQQTKDNLNQKGRYIQDKNIYSQSAKQNQDAKITNNKFKEDVAKNEQSIPYNNNTIYQKQTSKNKKRIPTYNSNNSNYSNNINNYTNNNNQSNNNQNNSFNTYLTQQPKSIIELSSPDIIHVENTLSSKNQFFNKNFTDKNSLVDNDIFLINQQTIPSLNYLNSTTQINSNFHRASTFSQFNYQQTPSLIKYQKSLVQKSNAELLENIQEIISPGSQSHRDSMKKNNEIEEKEEEYEDVNTAQLGLKQYKSQLNPKILQEDDLNNYTLSLQQDISQNVSISEIQRNKAAPESEFNIQSGRSSMINDQKSEEIFAMHGPSQLNNYSYPTDYLMKISKQ